MFFFPRPSRAGDGHAFMALFRSTVVYKSCVHVWGWGSGGALVMLILSVPSHIDYRELDRLTKI